MEPDLDAIRQQLCVLCRRKKTRTTAPIPGRPTDWRSSSVTNPLDRQPFTDVGAWEYVADLLDAGHPIQPIELEHPPGKTGYVLIVAIDDRELYVKLQLGAGQVIGRSFHYSERRTTQVERKPPSSPESTKDERRNNEP